MSLTLPVSVIGFGQVYDAFFNAVAATLGTQGYGSLILIMAVIGLFCFCIQLSITRNPMVGLLWIVTYCAITSIILLPNCTVVIQDRVDNNVYTVSHVPYGLGVLTSVVTTLGVGTAELFDSVFHLPQDLQYSQSGMLMGAQMVKAATHFQVVGGNFRHNLQGFVKQCVLYDVLLGKYTLSALANTPNLWTFVCAQASPARAFVYNGQVVTCQTGAQKLSQDWKTALANSTDEYAARLFPSNQNAKAQLLSYIGSSYQTLAQLSTSAAQTMQQNMMINAIQNGNLSFAASTNSQTAMADIALAKAQQQKREGYGLLYRLGVYWLPLVYTQLQLVMIGSFLIIILFLLFPGGMRVLKNYLYSWIWLQMWIPTFTLLNFGITKAQMWQLSAMTQASAGGHALTLHTWSSLNQMNADLGAVAGFLVTLTPIIAGGFFKGFMSVFTTAANYIGGNVQSNAFSTATEAVTGNLSLGNTQFENHSAFNVNRNHSDTNATVSGGLLSYQLQNGGMATITPDGTSILQSHSAISNLPVTPQLAQSLQSSFTHMADKSQSVGIRDSLSAQAAYSTGLRDIVDVGQSANNTLADGTAYNESNNDQMSTAARTVHQMVARFAKDNHLSFAAAENYLVQSYGGFKGGISAGGPLLPQTQDDAPTLEKGNSKDIGMASAAKEAIAKSLGVNAGADRGITLSRNVQDTVNKSDLLNKALSYTHDHNFVEAVDTVVRDAKDESYREDSGQMNRMATNIASSFDTGNRYAHDAAANFDAAKSYREQASLVEQNSVAINTQASQAFVDYLMTQPSIQQMGGGLDQQGVMDMMQHDLPLAQEYARDFVKSEEAKLTQQYQSARGHENVVQDYIDAGKGLGGEPSIFHTYEQQNTGIQNEATALGVGNVTNTTQTHVQEQMQKIHAKAAYDEAKPAQQTLKKLVDKNMKANDV